MSDEQPTTTTEEAMERNLCDCVACLSVPLSVLALEVDIPLGGWGDLLDQMGIRVTPDHIGRPSIAAVGARRLVAMLRRQDELFVEKAARRAKELDARRPVMAGVPAVEGLSPFESMVAAGGVQSPSQEFSDGRERPRFLEEALAEGAAADAEKRRAVAEKKQRLVAQMKDKLR